MNKLDGKLDRHHFNWKEKDIRTRHGDKPDFIKKTFRMHAGSE